MKTIDLRSDTVTRPAAEMRRIMAEAEVGDDVFGEDPTVNRLQRRTAELLGKQAALFVPSGTMANQIAIGCHTRPGDEVICEADCHSFNYEGGAPALLSGAQMRTLKGKRGVITANQIRDAIRPADHHFPRSRLILLENTHNRAGGAVFPLHEIEAIARLAGERNLAMHLDGARLWNASVATGVAPADYARAFDSISVCLSKGLGAPVGSLVAGDREMIDRAHRLRKLFGGGMRQAGIVAAAGLYALEHHIARLEQDHRRARDLAEHMNGLEGVSVDLEATRTNIVIATLEGSAFELAEQLRRHGLLSIAFSEHKIRFVTHIDIGEEDIQEAKRILNRVLNP